MDAELRNEIFTRLDALAEKLGTTASELLPKIQKLIIVEGVIWGLAPLAVSALLGAASWKCFRAWSNDDNEGAGIVGALAGFVALVPGAIGLDNVTRLFASEAYAIERLITMIRG